MVMPLWKSAPLSNGFRDEKLQRDTANRVLRYPVVVPDYRNNRQYYQRQQRIQFYILIGQ